MCGILGFASLKRNIFYNLNTKGIENRGPDNIGKFESVNVGLYHSRLAIIDNKESSNQPIINKDYYLVCNGEIYNHKKLRTELQDFDFLTNSDCETIIAAYHKFGVEGFSKLDGMYSFALYDKKRNKLIIHRDSVGKKPLYYFYDKKVFLFSSNITAIQDNIKKKLTIDKSQIDFYLRNSYINPTLSIFKEIKPLLPGQIFEIDIKTLDVKQFFIKNKFTFDIDFDDFNKVKNHLFYLIKKAIHKRLDGIKTPVILFSGGIDSTIIAFEAIKYNKNTKLLSIKQLFPFLNDEPYVRKFAQKFNISINNLNIMNINFIKNIDKFINKLDQPLGIAAYYYLSQLSLQAKSFDNVLLTGDGADEIFYGYRPFKEWIDEEGTDLSLINCKYNFKLSDYGYKQANESLIGHGFVKVDKSTAENQMEARCPFLDRELICFVRQIPKEFWVNKEIKFILKEYLINEGFDRNYVYRKKIGFAFPFRYVMIPKYKDIIKTIKRNRRLLKEYDIIDNPNYFDLYKKFNYYFSIYVLTKFLEKNV